MDRCGDRGLAGRTGADRAGGSRPETAGSLHATWQSQSRYSVRGQWSAAHGAGPGTNIVKNKKTKISLPIGRTALLAFQINSLRDECCGAAERILRQTPVNEAELEECARLEDALADAQRILKSAVARIAFSRLRRRSQAK